MGKRATRLPAPDIKGGGALHAPLKGAPGCHVRIKSGKTKSRINAARRARKNIERRTIINGARRARKKSYYQKCRFSNTTEKRKTTRNAARRARKKIILPETACDQGSFFLVFFFRNFQISENSPYIYIRNFTIYIPCMVNHIPAPAARGEYIRITRRTRE